MATRNVKLYGVKCAFCGKLFSSKSRKAKFCSDPCRLKNHRAQKLGNGRTLHDLTDQNRNRLQQILTINKPAYDQIFSLLELEGARIATHAIMAAYFVAETLIADMERMKND